MVLIVLGALFYRLCVKICAALRVEKLRGPSGISLALCASSLNILRENSMSDLKEMAELHQQCGTELCCGGCDTAQDWILIAINPWGKTQYNRKTGETRRVPLNTVQRESNGHH